MGPDATWILPSDMNDQNLEETSRYVSDLTYTWDFNFVFFIQSLFCLIC